MGVFRSTVQKAIEFTREEIIPLRMDLMKAGIIKPDPTAYDQKASLVDPWSQQASAFGYKEKFSVLDYSKCRQITYADPIVAAVIQTRLNQLAAFSIPQTDKYKVGFKIKMRDIEKKPSSADKKTIKEIEQFITHCGVPENFGDTPEIKRRDNFETFLRKIARDSLTFDQINFEITPRKNGLPYGFGAVDAATIRQIADKKEQFEQLGGASTAAPDVTAYESEKEFTLFKPKNPRYCQVINGMVRHVFDEWELCFGVRNPRTDILAQGYGFSEVEMLITTITSHMNAETYNRKFFSQGSSIKGVLAFEGSVPPDQLEAFRRQWYQQVSGINNAWRTPILALGKDSKLNWTSLHSTNREMEFGKWLDYCIKTICGVFQMDPIEIGFDISKQGTGQGGGGGGMGQGNQAERVMFSQDKGLRPLLRHIQYLINDYIVYRLDPNFEFEFVGFNVGDEDGDLERAIKQGKSFKTINEIRAEHDMKPMKMPEQGAPINPGDVILDPSWMSMIQAATQPQPEEGGAPGEEGDTDNMPGQGEPEGDPEDYDNMSDEELQSKLDELQSGEQSEGGKPGASKGKPPAGKPAQPKGKPSGKQAMAAPQAMKKSYREIVL